MSHATWSTALRIGMLLAIAAVSFLIGETRATTAGLSLVVTAGTFMWDQAHREARMRLRLERQERRRRVAPRRPVARS